MKVRPSQIIVGKLYYQCTRCTHWLPEDEFGFLTSARSRCKRKSWCSGCCADHAAGLPAPVVKPKLPIGWIVKRFLCGGNANKIGAKYGITGQTVRRYAKRRHGPDAVAKRNRQRQLWYVLTHEPHLARAVIAQLEGRAA